jgi:hypothetical protein
MSNRTLIALVMARIPLCNQLNQSPTERRVTRPQQPSVGKVSAPHTP